MDTRKLTIKGTAYSPFDVWNGEYHDVAVRFRKPATIVRDRGYVHVCAQNAAGYSASARNAIRGLGQETVSLMPAVLLRIVAKHRGAISGMAFTTSRA